MGIPYGKSSILQTARTKIENWRVARWKKTRRNLPPTARTRHHTQNQQQPSTTTKAAAALYLPFLSTISSRKRGFHSLFFWDEESVVPSVDVLCLLDIFLIDAALVHSSPSSPSSASFLFTCTCHVHKRLAISN